MREVIAQAESDYRIGRIEQARDTLLHDLGNFYGNQRQNALRLIALSYLARFDMEHTQQYATQMLQENPYYTPSSSDPPAFADMVNDIKAGMTATITTASSQAESLAEVPVPTTLITEQMIRDCGGRNLQEVLAAYVPGMNLIDCDDDINIAMRGIYSNTQEKILIMLNGHRLNSQVTNTAAPDFSISLEKVRQIEVLRGPASSLYGGVALTAVVNIITKQGADVDGLQVRAGAGNYGQIRADALFGKRYFDLDLLLWGSIYRSSGERRNVVDERIGESPYSMPLDEVRIGHIGDRPTYDFGLQLAWKGLQFLYDTHFSQVAAPFSMTSLALSYDYDRYRTYNGLKPGFSTASRHANLSYQLPTPNSKLSTKISVTYDKSDLTRYQAINDYPMPTLGMAIGLPEDISTVFTHYGGISRYVNGQEQDYGAQFKGNYSYSLGDDHKGNIGFGAEYGHFQLDDIRYQIGYDFEQTFFEDPVLRNAGKDSENSGNVYLQLKHQWDLSLFSYHLSFITNAGLRYDYKDRYDDSQVNEFSPRLALILLRPKWSLRLSYSKSFVDAPYIYRKANLLSTLMEGLDASQAGILSPERVHSLQLSFAGTNWVRALNFEVNAFYNRATDLIMTHIIDYENVSKNQTCGLELMATYQPSPTLSFNFNLTWTKTFKSNLMGLELPNELKEYYSPDIDDNNNTPALRSNLVVGWQTNKRLRLHGHLLFESRQTTYNTDLVKLIQASNNTNAAVQYYQQGDIQQATAYGQQAIEAMRHITLQKDMPPRAILNIGAQYAIAPVTLGLDIHNLFGTHYYRSGMNTNLIPQQGRWFIASIGIQL
ncbi:MAG: TonB-dependent receptor plug domain-containing protein [Prevotella sp.]|nr:TonB-dependent receptor plug domain-containing protein [Prevotella sp.]